MVKIDDCLKILVVDDTAVYRKIISDVLNQVPGVEVVDTANNGRDAMEKTLFYRPDILTLDLEMPEMDGLEVLTELQTAAPDVGAIIISTHTDEGGEMTIKALNRGAFDFILKPEHLNVKDNKETIRKQLELILEAFRFCRSKKKADVNQCRQTYRETISDQHHIKKSRKDPQREHRQEIIAIGVSTGGPRALSILLPMFPANLPVPVVIAQHMPSGFTEQLAQNLNRKCTLDVKEAEHMELLCPGKVFIAPGGKQMQVKNGPAGIKYLSISEEESGTIYKPSIDILFSSVAEQFGGNVTGVIMTGMGSDGYQGLKKMKRAGATIIAQDEESCIVYGMPAVAINAGIADQIVHLSDLADAITATLKSGKR